MSTDISRYSLSQLARKANDAAGIAETYATNAVGKAAESGAMLNAAKEKVPHGDWGQWLVDNWEYSVSTANKYMQLDKGQKTKSIDDSGSLRKALSAIAQASKPETPPEVVKPNSERVTNLDSTRQEGSDSEPADEEYEDVEPPERTSEPIDVAVDRARRKVPELIRSLRLQLGNMGLGGRHDKCIDRILEDAR